MIEKTTTYSRSANQNPGTAQPDKAPFSDGSGARGRDGLSPIDWIKRYRAIAGVTLREAKDAYDAGRPMPTSSAEIDAALERDAKRQALRDAAPDMFEALLQARDWLRGWASAEPQLAIIEAALAKATPTGEASDV